MRAGRPAPSRRRRRLWLGLIVALVSAAAGVPETVTRPWHDSSHYGYWTAVYHGYGEVTGDNRTFLLSPKAPDRPRDTHAALIVTRQSYRDFAATVLVRTERQLRTPKPQPWEVGWVLWRYRSPQHFYALVLKPTGWELSKQDPRFTGGQRFLASGRTPTFAVGSWHRIGIVHVGNRVDVSADGRFLTRFTDQEDPYLSGSLGLYSEDARAHFTGVQITPITMEAG